MSTQTTPQAQPGGRRELPTPPIPAQSNSDFAASCRAHAARVAQASTGTEASR